MAQSFTTSDGSVLTIPSASVSYTVAPSNSGLATTGVVMVVGEANQGPDYTLEPSISQNFFGPGQQAQVAAKYGSGRVVDAYNAVIAASNDPRVTGSPTSIYIVKTNPSIKASAPFVRSGLSNWGTLADQSYGAPGNLIYANVTAAQVEVPPTTGAFTYIPGPNLGGSDGSTLAVHVNGGAKQTLAIAHVESPTTLVGSITSGSSSGLNSLTGILATGGVNRTTVISGMVTVDVALVASGNSIVITLATGSWSVTPTVGDTLVLPKISTYGASANTVLAGGSGQNYGAYVVTASTSNTITALKLRDAAGTGVTAPANVSSVALAYITDILCYSPVIVTNMTGTNRGLISAALETINVTGTVTGQNLKLTLATGSQWAALPQAGDYLFIPSTAPTAISACGGWYQVVSATNGTAAGATTIVATNLNDTTPTAFGATALVATTDIQCIRPVIDGTGKALEIYDGAGNINCNTMFYTLAGAAVSWLSTAGTPVVLTSAAEYEATLQDLRQSTNTNETNTEGGTIALIVGYNGTTATMTISNTMLTTSVTGGMGANLSIALSSFKTLGDLANFINSQTGYTCSLSTTLVGQYPVLNAVTTIVGSSSVITNYSTLDQGTYGICSELGSDPGRIKIDAYSFFSDLSSSMIQIGSPIAQPASGLPEVQATFYLSGGTKGGSTGANVTGGIDACQKIKGNFLVTCFAVDAATDVTLGYTDPSSTYTIAGVNAYAKSHVLLMSQIKRAKNRQAFIAQRTSFQGAMTASQNIANFRCAMNFLDFKQGNVQAQIVQYQPWIGSALAAGMTAAASFRGLVKKLVNTNGVVMGDGSFDPNDDDQVTEALQNGLMVVRPADGGGWEWVSDQTCYGADKNFVYNSIQAIYVADTVALTLKQRMEKAFVGIDLAEVSANTALAFLKGILSDLKRLKYITASDDAPAGWKNASIQISGPAMLVSLEIKLNTLLYFIGISFLVTPVQQSASA